MKCKYASCWNLTDLTMGEKGVKSGFFTILPIMTYPIALVLPAYRVTIKSYAPSIHTPIYTGLGASSLR